MWLDPSGNTIYGLFTSFLALKHRKLKGQNAFRETSAWHQFLRNVTLFESARSKDYSTLSKNSSMVSDSFKTQKLIS